MELRDMPADVTMRELIAAGMQANKLMEEQGLEVTEEPLMAGARLYRVLQEDGAPTELWDVFVDYGEQLTSAVEKIKSVADPKSYPTERLPDEVFVKPSQTVPRHVLERKVVESQAVSFMPGEPTTLADFGGQEHIIDYLEHAIGGMSETDLAIEPILFTGTPGLGKTTLAKVVTQELIGRAELMDRPLPDWIEVFPADVPNVAALDAIMERVLARPGSVLFVDEIHDVKEDTHWRKLYLFLNECRYKFEGQDYPIQMPPTTVMAATTDDGDLPDALKRRFQVWRFEPATREQLREYVKRRPFPISAAGLELILDRLGDEGRPWEVLQCYNQSVTYAKGKGRDYVKLEDVEQALENRGVDAYGLGKEDREVIRALLSIPPRKVPGLANLVYVLSESNIVGMTGLHKVLYAKTIKPKLLKRGMLTVRNGQMLTDKAVQIYGPYFQPSSTPVELAEQNKEA